MSRKNQKEKEKIHDPVVKFGKQLQNRKMANKKRTKNPEMLEKLARGGCDDGFVYYED